MIFSFG